MRYGLAGALDDVAQIASADPLLTQLHQLAQAIVLDRNYIDQQLANVSNADAQVDWQGMTTAAQSIAQLTAQFRTIAARRAAQTQQQQDDALTTLEAALVDIGTWAQGVVDAIPSALSAVPNAFIGALSSVANTALSGIGGAASTALVAALPLLAGIGLVILLARQGEKSRTYRKYVA